MAKFKEYAEFDGVGLANLVKQRIVTPAELLEAAIERIDLLNPSLNAVICKLYSHAETALKQTISAGPFQGVPFLLKDLLTECEGTPLRFGSRFAQSWVSTSDSELVKRYKAAGLVILGKTNTPEFGLSPFTDPKLFGSTLNPWDLRRTAGGSSGGSAVAVATGMVPIAHGGDGGGSLRIPAAYCGVLGFKPSRGRTPVGPKILRLGLGMIVEHVLTRSVRDCAAMLDISCGEELGSPISLAKPSQSFLDTLKQKPKKLRIAMTDQPLFYGETHPEYSQALKKAGLLCQQLGHQVEAVNLTINREEIMRAYTIVILAELNTDINAIARWMNKKVSYHEFEISTAVGYRTAKCFSAADFDWAICTLDAAAKQIAEFMQNYDVIMTPTMPIPPPEIGFLEPKRLEKWMLQLALHLPRGSWMKKFVYEGADKIFALTTFTVLFNITGQPAMSVPLYWDQQGLPIGIQFAGRYGEDALLLQLAQQLEEAQPWMDKKPILAR